MKPKNGIKFIVQTDKDTYIGEFSGRRELKNWFCLYKGLRIARILWCKGINKNLLADILGVGV